MNGVPYVRGSPTSRDAALEKRRTALADKERVFALIEAAGDDGMTDKEIEHAIGGLHEGVSARRRGLVLDEGRVRNSGRTRPTPSGRQAVVWVVGRETNLIVGTPLGRVARPTREEMLAAHREIRRLVKQGRAQGLREPLPELQKLGAWILHLAREA
jgi:hypothetical protein